MALCEGDVLCVGGSAEPGALEVFSHVVLGHPMLGQVVKQQLRSLPGGIPCAARHWESLGALRAVWRSLAEPCATGAASVVPEEGASVALARRAVCVRVPAPAVALTRAAHPEWLGRPIHLVEQGAAPFLVFSETGGGAPVPVPPPAAADLEAAAGRLADLLGAGAEVEQVSPSELRVVTHLALDLRAATALARRLGRHLRLPLVMAVADELDEARRFAGRLAVDQLLFVLPGLACGAQVEPVSPPVALCAPPSGLVASAAPQRVFAPAAPRRLPRPDPPADGAVQLSLFGGAEAA
jgi:hypothetical protein